MLKIVTDPAEGWPNQEVDLSHSDGQLSVTPLLTLENRDLTFLRPFDGGTNVIFRKRRSAYAIGIDYIGWKQYEQILRLIELRTPLYIFPNFDNSTLVNAPMQGQGPTVKPVFWQWDPATRALKTTPQVATFTRSGTAYTEDNFGRFQSVAADVARYTKGALGHGITQERAWTNVAEHKHPSSGNLPFTTLQGGGAQAPVWDTNVLSPVTSFGGSARLDYNQNVSAHIWHWTFNDGDTVAGKARSSGMWLLGDATVHLELQMNGLDQAVSRKLRLRPDKWQRIDLLLSPKPSTGESANIILNISAGSESDGSIYVGPCYHKVGPAGDKDPPPSVWTDTSISDETIELPLTMSAGNVSIAWTGKLYNSHGPGQLWRATVPWSFDTPDLFRAKWTTTGRLQVNFGATASLNPLLTWPPIAEDQPTIGHDYYASLVLDIAREGSQPTDEPSALEQRARLVIVTKLGTFVQEKTGSAFLAGLRHATKMVIGTTGSADDSAGPAAIAHVRVDARAWTAKEQDLHARLYSEDGFKQVLASTAGRRFRIVSVDLNPRTNRWNDIVGTIVVEEIDQNPDLTIGPR